MIQKHKTLILFGFILLLGLGIRLTALMNAIGPPQKIYPTMDEMDYREFAENIIIHKTYSAYCQGFFASSTRAPVYPMIIASVYKLGLGDNFSALKYLNLIFDMINICLVFLLAYSMFGRKTALFSAFYYAVFGHSVFYMLQTSPHIVGVMVFLAVCLTISKIHKYYRILLPVLILLYSILIHLRPVFLISLPFLPIALWFQLKVNSFRNPLGGKSIFSSPEFKKKFLKCFLPVFFIVILCLPWGYRNYKMHKTLVPVCTVAGWHIANNVNFDLKLSIKYFTDGLYAKEHKNFTEGQYFIFAKQEFLKSFLDNPVKFIAFGVGRLVYLWSPPKPYLRIFMPQSYIFPIYLDSVYFIPLLDFEGLLYLTFIFSIIILLVMRKRIEVPKKFIGKCFYRMSGPVILCLGYALVHIIGIPLIAYRLFLEPMVAIFCIYILLNAITFLIRKRKQQTNFSNFHYRIKINNLTVITLYLILLMLVSFLFFPFLSTSQVHWVEYKKLHLPLNSHSYQSLKITQWNNKGNIQANTKVVFQGVIRYMHKGFKYILDDYYAVADNNYAASRIFIQYNSKEYPLGIGDARLNFDNFKKLPENNSTVVIYGTANTGIFKEIIVNVSSWKNLHN